MSGIVVKLYLDYPDRDSDESSDLEDWTGEAASAGVSRMVLVFHFPVKSMARRLEEKKRRYFKLSFLLSC